jgi:hypothetical protein
MLIIVDDRKYLGVDEFAGPLQVVALGVGELVAQAEVVGTH